LCLGVSLGLIADVVFSTAYAQAGREARRRRVEPEAQPAKPATQAAAPGTVAVTIVDATTNEPLVGANVILRNAPSGGITNDRGMVQLQVPPGTRTLVISYVGYVTQEVTLQGEASITVKLTEGVVTSEEVVVSASRVAERLKETPISIQKLSLGDLASTPQLSAYDAVSTAKEIDYVQQSMGVRTYNARGFQAATNNRFVTRVDGADFLSPGNNASPGFLTGPIDIDVENVEIIVGPASALYGANAVNGLINITTKSPFTYQGASAYVRWGVNHVDNKDLTMSPLFDIGFRFAKSITPRLAFKISGQAQQARDWVANSTVDVADYSITPAYAGTTGPGNPGYDGMNIYGDEVSNVFYAPQLWSQPTPTPFATPVRISRTGYREQDIFNYNFYSYKAGAALHFKIKPDVELIASSRLTNYSTILVFGLRSQLQNGLLQQHKLELTGPRFFIRAYGNFQANPKINDSSQLIANMNRSVKSDENWFAQYIAAFTNGNGDPGFPTLWGSLGLGPLPRLGNDADARAFADRDNSGLIPLLINLGVSPTQANFFGGGGRLRPGTQAFSDAVARVGNLGANVNGSQLTENSGIYHVEGQYDFSDVFKPVQIQAGAMYRLYTVDSRGTIYQDIPGQLLSNYEYGAYVQAAKSFLNDRLKITGAVRYDKNVATDGKFSPRLAAVLRLDAQGNHYLRASVQQGFRQPNMVHLYADLNFNVYRQVNTGGTALAKYGLQNNNYTLESVTAYRQSFLNPATPLGDSTLLQRFNYNPIQPENTLNLEAGYRGTFDKLYVDLTAYLSEYRNFIGLVTVYGPAVGRPDYRLRAGDVAATSDPAVVSRTSVYVSFVNFDNTIRSYGASLGLNYNLTRKLTLTSNGSFTRFQNVATRSVGGLLESFSTPAYRCNVGLQGRKVIGQNFGFNLLYRWVDSYQSQSLNIIGVLPAYNLVDLVLTYDLPRVHSQVKVGGTNILNNRHVEIIAGPNIGSIFYVQLSFDPLMFSSAK
jgi:outer membrane receptor protein involved in Fe transport